MDTEILFHKIAELESEKGNLEESNGRLQSKLDTYNDYLLPRATPEAKEIIDNHQFSKISIVPCERLKSLKCENRELKLECENLRKKLEKSDFEIQRLREKCGEVPKKSDEEKKKPIDSGYIMRIKDFYAFTEHFKTIGIEYAINTVPVYTVRFEDGTVEEFNESELGKTKEEVQMDCDKSNEEEKINAENKNMWRKGLYTNKENEITAKRKFDIGDVVLCHKFSIGGRIVISENGFHDERYLDTSYFNRKAFISNTYKRCMEQYGEVNPEDKGEYEITFLDNGNSLAWVSGDDLKLLLKMKN